MAESALTMRWTPVRQQPRWERALTHPPRGCPVLRQPVLRPVHRATPCRPRQARSPRRAPCQEPGVIAGCREYDLHAPPALSRAAPAARPAAGSATLRGAAAQPPPPGDGFSPRCPMLPGSRALTLGFRGHCGSAAPNVAALLRPREPGPASPRRPRPRRAQQASAPAPPGRCRFKRSDVSAAQPWQRPVTLAGSMREGEELLPPRPSAMEAAAR